MKIDPQNYQQVKSAPRKQEAPKEYREVAEGMEAQFVHHMLQEMRKGVHKATPESNTESLYNNLIDYERAQMIAKDEENLGIKDLVLDQIYYRRFQPRKGFNGYNTRKDEQ